MEERDVVLFVVYLNMILYATCYQIQRPLEPFLVDSLIQGNAAHTADEYAKLQSFFSVMQTIGSMFTGYFLDRVGVRAGFIVSYAAAGFSYYLLSMSSDISILYVSKIPTILQAGYLVSQLAVSQVTYDGPDRLTALGRLTMCYTIGSIIGPTVGGLLGDDGDYFFAARVAVAGSIISLALTLLLLPNGSTDSPRRENTSLKMSSIDDLTAITSNTSNTLPTVASTSSMTSLQLTPPTDQILGFAKVFSMVWLLLCTKVTTSLANSISASAMPLILKYNYHMNEVGLGYTMSSMSAFNALVNGLLLGPITQFVGGNVTIVIEGCIFGMTGVLILQSILATTFISSRSLFNGLIEYMVLLFILNMFQFVLATALTGESTSRVGPNSKGTLLGLEHSLFAAARILTPQVGVKLLQYGGISCVSGTCAVVFIFVSWAWKSYRHTLGPGSTSGSDHSEDVKVR